MAHDGFVAQIYDNINGVGSGICFHGLNVAFAVFVYFIHCFDKGFVGNHFFREKIAEALFFKGGRIENLIAAAGRSRERNQDIRFI